MGRGKLSEGTLKGERENLVGRISAEYRRRTRIYGGQMVRLLK